MRGSNFKFAGSWIAVAAAMGMAAPVQAAVVTWSTPSTVSGDTDVITTGTLVAARNFSSTQLTTTVNGVFFDIFPIPNLGCCAAGIPGVASLSYAPVSDSSDTAYGSASAPFNTLSAPYQTLLGSGAGSSTGSAQSFTLFGLTSGTTYILQWWTNDSGLVYGGTNSTSATAGNSVSLDENTTDAVGGLGQWVTGTFTADNTFQAISLTGPRPEINAFQLRAIPPVPAIAASGWVVLAGLLLLTGAIRARPS